MVVGGPLFDDDQVHVSEQSEKKHKLRHKLKYEVNPVLTVQ
jgi:hypothetical protein